MQSSPIPSHLFPLTQKYLPQLPILEQMLPKFFQQCDRPSLKPVKRDKMTLLCAFMFAVTLEYFSKAIHPPLCYSTTIKQTHGPSTQHMSKDSYMFLSLHGKVAITRLYRHLKYTRRVSIPHVNLHINKLHNLNCHQLRIIQHNNPQH